MINIKSTETDNENEIINFIGKVDEVSPFFSVVIDRSILSVSDKSTYDDVLSILTNDSDIEIINTLSEVTIDRMTSSSIVKDSNNVLDFLELPIIKQNKLKAFMELAITLNS